MGDVARSKVIRRVRYEDDAVEAIAATLGVAAHPAPFSLPGGRVYQFVVPNGSERPVSLVTLWPSLRRVDAIAGPATVVMTDVAGVTLVEAVEVMFRRATGELLIVARSGKVIVRA